VFVQKICEEKKGKRKGVGKRRQRDEGFAGKKGKNTSLIFIASSSSCISIAILFRVFHKNGTYDSKLL
jgi:hypothetical protein